MATRPPFTTANPREWFRNELRDFFRDIGRLPRSRARSAHRTTGVFPKVNLYDDGEGFRILAELPGVDEENLEISAERESIDVRGERTVEAAGDEANYHRRERGSGHFRRTLTLPQPIDLDGVAAKLEKGVLDIYAPRSERARSRQIDIE